MKPQEAFAFSHSEFSQLKKMVAKGEGLTLEFKRKAAFPQKLIREMIAFANTKGGILLVGIGDDGTIPGLKFPEDESLAVKQALKNCKPPLAFNETFIPIGQCRSVLQYEVPESKRKPHYLITIDNTKETYVRVADKSIKASREVREIVQRTSKKKDIQFKYGEHEKLLMQYLDANPSITLKKFIELTGLKRFYASRKLVLLVLANVLRVMPHEKGDEFLLAFKKE